MKFNFKKIAAGFLTTTFVGMTFGIATAVSPSSQFTQGDTTIVYGSDAASTDMVAATSIQAALGLSDETSTDVGAPTEGDFYKIEKGNTKFNLGNGISDVLTTSLDDGDLSTILADGTYRDDNNDDYDYTQEIDLANLSLTHFEHDENDDEPTIGFDVPKNTYILNYTLDFTENPPWSGLESTDITIMGKDYYISDVTTNTTIELLDSSSSTLLNEGESETISVGGSVYEVSISFIGSTSVKLAVNGEVTNSLSEGETYQLVDGAYIAIEDILVQDFQGGTRQVEFSIGNGQVTLVHGQEVEINDEDVDNLRVYFENSNEELASIVLEWKAEEDSYITEDGETLLFPAFETVEISYTGMTFPEEETFEIRRGSSDTSLVLDDFPVVDGTFDIEVLYGNGTTWTGVGKDSNEGLQTTNNSVLTYDGDDDKYFIVTYENGDEFESYIVQATDFDQETDDITNTTTFQKRSGNSWVDVDANVENGDTVDFGEATITVGDIDYDAETVVITAGTNTYFDRLYSAEGLRLLLPYEHGGAVNYTLDPGQSNALQTNTTATGYNNPTSFSLQFAEEDEDDTGAAGNKFNVTVNWASDEPSVGSIDGDQSQIEIGDSDTYESFIYGPLATMFVEDTGGDQDTVAITYHGAESSANVYVAESGSSGSTSTTTNNVVFMDDEVTSSAASRNWIVVGGSAVNTVAADLLGVNYPSYGSAWEAATGGVGTGSWLIRTFDHPTASGKVATLVAGYNAGDTTNAATFFTTQDPEIEVGTQYVGQTGTTATSSVVSN